MKAERLIALYTSEQGRLGRLVRRLTGNATVAEDLVQDSFLKLLGIQDASRIDDDRAYLTRIASNLAINHRRREKRAPFVRYADEDLFALPDPSLGAEALLADKQALRLTLAAIAALPARTRQAFELHRLGEHTLAVIGRRMGISTSLAGRLVQEGYKAVRDQLREHGGP
jgi:RNA polymerase sigma-70 factor (ECF subfamily)